MDDTLRKDGVTVLRLISDNCGDLVTAEIVAHLWRVGTSKTKSVRFFQIIFKFRQKLNSEISLLLHVFIYGN